jgi:hypothetical protein
MGARSTEEHVRAVPGLRVLGPTDLLHVVYPTVVRLIMSQVR